MWREWLTLWGFEVGEAENGAEAIEKVRAWPPALVIMDLTMPVMDGVSATLLLKRHRATTLIPVLAMSADVTPPTPQQALAAGCDEFIAKPVRAEDLLSAIRRAFRRVRELAQAAEMRR